MRRLLLLSFMMALAGISFSVATMHAPVSSAASLAALRLGMIG
jgi:hypothetical protein